MKLPLSPLLFPSVPGEWLLQNPLAADWSTCIIKVCTSITLNSMCSPFFCFVIIPNSEKPHHTLKMHQSIGYCASLFYAHSIHLRRGNFKIFPGEHVPDPHRLRALHTSICWKTTVCPPPPLSFSGSAPQRCYTSVVCKHHSYISGPERQHCMNCSQYTPLGLGQKF